MLVLNLPKPGRVQPPVLVVGAEHDAIFPPGQVAATARAYRTTALMFPDMAHDMMLERGWEAVAAAVVAWLRESGHADDRLAGAA